MHFLQGQHAPLIRLYWLSRLVLLYEPAVERSMSYSWTSKCPPRTNLDKQTNKQTNKLKSVVANGLQEIVFNNCIK